MPSMPSISSIRLISNTLSMNSGSFQWISWVVMRTMGPSMLLWAANQTNGRQTESQTVLPVQLRHLFAVLTTQPHFPICLVIICDVSWRSAHSLSCVWAGRSLRPANGGPRIFERGERGNSKVCTFIEGQPLLLWKLQQLSVIAGSPCSCV